MHQDVAALDISMDDAGLVQETQAQKNLSRVTGDDALRKGTKGFEHVRHAAAGHPFLEYVDHPFCLVDCGANVAHDVDVAKLTHELNLVGQCVDGVTLPGDVQLLDGEEFSLEIWGKGREEGKVSITKEREEDDDEQRGKACDRTSWFMHWYTSPKEPLPILTPSWYFLSLIQVVTELLLLRAPPALLLLRRSLSGASESDTLDSDTDRGSTWSCAARGERE